MGEGRHRAIDQDAPVRTSRVSRRSLLTGLGGGVALTATTTFAATPARADDDPPVSTANVVASGLGKKQAPRWTTERSIPCRTPGHAQYVAEPGLDGGSLWVGDSTFEINRAPFQYAQELARRNPGMRIVYDKGNWGGGSDVAAKTTTKPSTGFAAFVPGDLSGAFSQILNAASWAAQGGSDQRQPIPGIRNYALQLPPAAKYTPWGANSYGSSLTRGAVGVDVAPVTWLASSAQVLLAQDDTKATDGRGTLLRVRSDGRVELRLAMDGAGTRVLAAVTTVPVTSVVADGARCAVLFDFDLDRNGRSIFTPWYRVGGHGRPWLPLGAPITLAKQTGAWRGSPLVPWEVGGGGTFRGDFFEAFVRKVDRSGPDMIPRLPQQWTPTTPSMKGTLQGGRTYWMTVLPWPGHGLDDFADRTDYGKPGTPVFTRTWNKDPVSAANTISPMDVVPQLPYLMTVLDSGHNEITTGSRNGQLLRSVHTKLVARAPEAEHCVLVQNATLRADVNTTAKTDGTMVFDQTNTTGFRRSHDWRIAQYTAIARTMGCEVLDGRSDMVDYVRAGGALSDLIQAGGEQVHPNAAGATLIALGLLNQTTTTDFGLTGVLP